MTHLNWESNLSHRLIIFPFITIFCLVDYHHYYLLGSRTIWARTGIRKTRHHCDTRYQHSNIAELLELYRWIYNSIITKKYKRKKGTFSKDDNFQLTWLMMLLALWFPTSADCLSGSNILSSYNERLSLFSNAFMQDSFVKRMLWS